MEVMMRGIMFKCRMKIMFDIIIASSFSSQVLQLLRLSFIDLNVLYSTRKIVYSQSLKFIGRNEIKTGSPWTVVSLAIETLASIWQTYGTIFPQADLFSSTSLFFSIPGRTLDPRSHYPTLRTSWVGSPRAGTSHPHGVLGGGRRSPGEHDGYWSHKLAGK